MEQMYNTSSHTVGNLLCEINIRLSLKLCMHTQMCLQWSPVQKALVCLPCYLFTLEEEWVIRLTLHFDSSPALKPTPLLVGLNPDASTLFMLTQLTPEKLMGNMYLCLCVCVRVCPAAYAHRFECSYSECEHPPTKSLLSHSVKA